MKLIKRKKFSKLDGKKQGMYHSFLLLIFLLVVLTLLSQIFIGISSVSGISMYPTYKDGQPVVYYRLEKEYKYGDVVAIKMPGGERYIKRIVGLPGDVIDIVDGTLYINGEPEVKTQAHGRTETETVSVHFPLTVEEDRYFTLGDNREASVDSRTYGTVNIQQIQGKVLN